MKQLLNPVLSIFFSLFFFSISFSAFAASDAQKGEKLFNQRCGQCHTIDKGREHGVGPNLYGIYSSRAGARQGYAYSRSMLESNRKWDDDSLRGYLSSPRKFLRGTRMAFAGFKKNDDLDAIIFYLKQSSSIK